MGRIRTIWKFPVQVKPDFVVEIPSGGEVLSVQVQYMEPVMWVMVDPDAPKEQRRFTVKGTGHHFDISDLGRFIGTFQLAEGNFIGHLFERNR